MVDKILQEVLDLVKADPKAAAEALSLTYVCKYCGESDTEKLVKNKKLSRGVERLCNKCAYKRNKPAHDNYRKNHKEERDAYGRVYKESHKEEISISNKVLKQNTKYHQLPEYIDVTLRRRYNISLDDYNKLLASQDFSCAICRTHVSELRRRLSVDHNHVTGKVRGLLCDQCNLLLGKACDNIDLLYKVIEYIKCVT